MVGAVAACSCANALRTCSYAAVQGGASELAHLQAGQALGTGAGKQDEGPQVGTLARATRCGFMPLSCAQGQLGGNADCTMGDEEWEGGV